MQVTGKDGLVVDIATRVVGDDEDIFVIQPGEGFHLYDRFDSASAVFMDLPDLGLDFSKPIPNWENLRETIVRSLAIKDWVVAGKHGAGPSRDIADYAGKAHGRRLGRYAGAVQSLYFELKKSAIIMVPGQHYADDVLIGELAAGPTYRSWQSLYAGERMAVRPVHWLRRKQRASFSPEVRARLGTPNPILQLDRSLRDEVITVAFDQYAFGGEFAARLNTHKADFSILDDYNIQTFVNYVGGVLAALELGHTGSELSFSDALGFLENNRELTPELAQNINSPGFQRLYNATLAPIVIVVFLTMATGPTTAAGHHHHLAAPQIVNSAAAKGDPCAIEVAKRVEGAMKLMKLDEWKMVCERAQKAKEQTGLSTSMKVKS